VLHAVDQVASLEIAKNLSVISSCSYAILATTPIQSEHATTFANLSETAN